MKKIQAKYKDFYMLMIGKAISLIGSNMQQFALSLYVFAKTGSATIFASILAIAIIPRLVLSPFAGVFGDWFDRKKSIVILDIINGCFIGIMAIVFYIYGELPLPAVYILVLLLEATEIFFNSAMAAVVPSIVEKDDLPYANSFKSVINNIGNIAAPLIAGVLYGFVGLQIILIINAVSFICSAIGEMMITIPKNHKRPDKITLQAFKDDFIGGIKVLKENKLISSVIGIGTILNFCLGSLFSVGIIYIIKEILKCSDVQFGIYQSLATGSMLLAPIVASGVFKKYKTGRILVAGSIINGVFIILMGIVSSKALIGMLNNNMVVFILITLITIVVASVVTMTNISLSTLFDQVVPLEYMGRTATVFSMGVTISIPIGQMIFGALYDTVPVIFSVGLSGVIMMVSIMFFRKTLLNADGEPEVMVEVQQETA